MNTSVLGRIIDQIMALNYYDHIAHGYLCVMVVSSYYAGLFVWPAAFGCCYIVIIQGQWKRWTRKMHAGVYSQKCVWNAFYCCHCIFCNM